MTRWFADRVFFRMVDAGNSDSDNRLQYINIVFFSSVSIDRSNENVLIVKEPIILRVMDDISRD